MMRPALADALVNGMTPHPGGRAPGRPSTAGISRTKSSARALKSLPTRPGATPLARRASRCLPTRSGLTGEGEAARAGGAATARGAGPIP